MHVDRSIQGSRGGGIISITKVIITDMVLLHERGNYFAGTQYSLDVVSLIRTIRFFPSHAPETIMLKNALSHSIRTICTVLSGLSGVAGVADLFLRHFDLNHVLVTEQGFEGMRARRLGSEGLGGGDGKGVWNGRGRRLWRRRIRKLVILVLGFWGVVALGLYIVLSLLWEIEEISWFPVER